MLESWAAAIVRRPAMAGERRSTPRPFQQVVEEVAERTVRGGSSVSVLVIRLGAASFRPGAAHRLASQIRSHLRADEPAGALTDGEIAAVLFDTNPHQARAVVARLRRLGENLDEGAALTAAAVGVAHCAAGSVYDTPLILAARQNALRAEGGGDSGQSLS
jgi:GGDEF domain-containing protein